MSIFGIIKSDDKVFTGDKLLINVADSFLTPPLEFATVSHEISVDNGVTWFDVSSKMQLGWVFTTPGLKTISLRVSTTEPSSQVFTKTINALDIVAAKLFSKDEDLYLYEPEIDQYLPKKWSSWNPIHKAAQDWIIDWLDEKRIFNKNGAKYTVADILDIQQVRQLSCYKALEFIFQGNSNVVGDIFSVKRDKYRELANEKASRSQLALDYDADSVAGPQERTDLNTVILRRG